MNLEFIYFIILLLLSGFFSGSEIALISLSNIKVRAMITKGIKSARIIEKLKNNPQRLLITILIGNTFVNIGASVLTTVWITKKYGDHFLGVTTGILTILILIFGEIFPKILAERFSSQFSRIIALPIYYIQFALFPFVWILEKKVHFLMRAFGKNNETITKDEVKAMLSFGVEEGAIENDEKELIHNVMEFDKIRVSQIMTPRAKMNVLPHTSLCNEAIDFIVNEGNSRIPIYKKDIDNIIGILTIQDVLIAKKRENKNIRVDKIGLKTPIFVPETKFINEIFKDFRWKRQHMAIVVNEHGNVTGLVTMEDLLEEIVGDIVDESDNENILIEKLSEHSWRINSEVTIEEVNDALLTTFECEDNHKSVGYLLLEKFQKIPRRGEDIKINGFHFFIEKIEGNKIHSVRVVKI